MWCLFLSVLRVTCDSVNMKGHRRDHLMKQAIKPNWAWLRPPAPAQRRVRSTIWRLRYRGTGQSVRPEALRHRLSTALPFTESAYSVLLIRVLVNQVLWVNRQHLSYEARIRMMLNYPLWVFPRVLDHTVRLRSCRNFPEENELHVTSAKIMTTPRRRDLVLEIQSSS
jgi:hypothetical protein